MSFIQNEVLTTVNTKRTEHRILQALGFWLVSLTDDHATLQSSGLLY